MTFFSFGYSPIQALAASMKLSVSLQLLDLGQSVGLFGRVISSSQTRDITLQNSNLTPKYCVEYLVVTNMLY
jgi:hypothetical protein